MPNARNARNAGLAAAPLAPAKPALQEGGGGSGEIERWRKNMDELGCAVKEIEGMVEELGDVQILQFWGDEQLQSHKHSLNTLEHMLARRLTAVQESIGEATTLGGERDALENLLQRSSDVKLRLEDTNALIHQVLDTRKQWKERGGLKMLVTTFNVGHAPLKVAELDQWIPRGGGGSDFVVVGLQECSFDLDTSMRKSVASEEERKREVKHELHRANAAASAKASSGVLAENPSRMFGGVSHYLRLKVENEVKKPIKSAAGGHVLLQILGHLGTEYALVRKCGLGQMFLFVISRKEHMHAITDVQYASEATGVGGIGANKGALAATLRLYGMKLGWISCHLTAHRLQRKLKSRNETLREIMRLFDRKLGAAGYNLSSELDHLFVLGDLNYRTGILPDPQAALDEEADASSQFALDGRSETQVLQQEAEVEDMGKKDIELDANAVPECSTEGIQQRTKELKGADSSAEEWNFIVRQVWNREWDLLFKRDQLRKAMEEGEVLTMFREGTYNFPPTFKVIPTFSGVKYNTFRCPSYCDRILWHSIPGSESQIKQISLKPSLKVTTSDHKPVVSEFVLDMNSAFTRQKLFASLLLANSTRLKTRRSAPPNAGLQIRVFGLKVTGVVSRDLDGHIVPYVVFCSPNLFPSTHHGYNPRKGAGRTKALKRRQSALWIDSNISLVKLLASFDTPASVKHGHIVLALWDRARVSRSELLGQANLGLEPVAEALEEVLEKEHARPRPNMAETAPKAFELPILHSGHHIGQISGFVQLLGSLVPTVIPKKPGKVAKLRKKLRLLKSCSPANVH